MAIAVSAAATSLHGQLSDTHARKSCRSAHSIPSGQAAFHNGKEQHIACPSALIWGGSWVQQVIGIDSRGCTPVKAEWVSTWDDRPTPGPYSFTVSWSMSDSTPGSSRCARCAARAAAGGKGSPGLSKLTLRSCACGRSAQTCGYAESMEEQLQAQVA